MRANGTWILASPHGPLPSPQDSRHRRPRSRRAAPQPPRPPPANAAGTAPAPRTYLSPQPQQGQEEDEGARRRPPGRTHAAAALPACRPPPPLAPGRAGEGRREKEEETPLPPPLPPPRSIYRAAPAPNNAAFQALSIAPRSSMQSSPASFYSPYSLASLFLFFFFSPFFLSSAFSFLFYFIIAIIIPILLLLSGRRAARGGGAPRDTHAHTPRTHTHIHTRTCSARTARRPSGSAAAARLHLAHGGRRGGRPRAHAPIHMHEGGRRREGRYRRGEEAESRRPLLRREAWRAVGPSRPEAGGPPSGRRENVRPPARRCRPAHLKELPAAPSRRRDPPLAAVALLTVPRRPSRSAGRYLPRIASGKTARPAPRGPPAAGS